MAGGLRGSLRLLSRNTIGRTSRTMTPEARFGGSWVCARLSVEEAMFNTVLSYSESAVLKVIGQTGEAYRTELPSKTQLAPREVGVALDSLVEKRFLTLDNGEVRLTREGRGVLATMSGRASSGPSRVLLTDDISAKAIHANTQSLRLNESIDKELKKLQK